MLNFGRANGELYSRRSTQYPERRLRKKIIMSKCGNCDSTIIMGGVRGGNAVYCNKNCYQQASIAAAARNIPKEMLDQKVDEVWRGLCPKQRHGAGRPS